MDIESRVKKVEHDISEMRSDLDYLRPLTLKAFEYMLKDPAASLNKARIAGEAICKRLYELTGGMEKGGKPPRQLKFEGLMHHLRKILPSTIIYHLENVQRFGNYGSHDQGPNSHPAAKSDALTCLMSLSTVTSRYFEEYYSETVQILDNVDQADVLLQKGTAKSLRVKDTVVSLPRRNEESRAESKLPARTSYFLSRLPRERRNGVAKAIELAQKRGLRISLSASALAIKIREDVRSDLLWKPTLALITAEGEVEIVPKWLVPDVAAILGSGPRAENLFQGLVGKLEPLRVRHSKYPKSYYYDIRTREEEFIAIIAETEKAILKKISNRKV